MPTMAPTSLATRPPPDGENPRAALADEFVLCRRRLGGARATGAAAHSSELHALLHCVR